MKKTLFYFLFLLASFITMNLLNHSSITINALGIKVDETIYKSEDVSISSVTLTTYISSTKEEYVGVDWNMDPIIENINYYSYNNIYIYNSINERLTGYENNTGMPTPIYTQEFINFSPGSYSLNILSSGNQSHMRLNLISSNIIRNINLTYSVHSNSTTITSDFISNESFYLVFYSSVAENKELSTITFSPITIEQTDNSSPVFEPQVFITGTNNPASLEYILSQVKFVDEVDGDILVTKDDVQIDTYSSNKYNVGKWEIEVSVSDRSNNKAVGTIEVWVQDKTPPVITGTTNFTSNMSSPITEQYLKSSLTIEDNVDTTFSINIIENTFTGNEQSLGTYKISYNTTDSNGNTSNTFTILITTFDDIKPIIEGTNSYSSSYQTLIDIETIKQQIIVSDNITSSDLLDIKIKEDTYTTNFNKPGVYKIIFNVIDENNNTSDDFIINIEVSDIVPPLFYTNNSFIGISKATSLSKEELSKILIDIEGLTNTENTIEILSSQYNFQNNNGPGLYTVSYILKHCDDTLDQIRNLTIKVYDENFSENEKEETITIKKQTSILNKIIHALKYFFVNLFKSIAFIFTFGKIKPCW